MNKSAPDTRHGGAAPAEKSDTCYLIDDASLIPGALEALTAAQPTVDFVAGQSNKLNDYKAEVETDKSKSILVIAAGKTGQPELTFYSTDFMSGCPPKPSPGWCRTCTWQVCSRRPVSPPMSSRPP